MKPKFVYVISDGEDVKIGVASDPNARLKELQTGNKKKLVLEYCELKNDPFKVEKHLHRQFSGKRLHGEWYSGLTVREIRVEILLCTDYD